MRARNSARFVYFATAGAMVKIGCSNQPQERLTQIGEWIPFKIQLAAVMPGGYAEEAAIHRMFAEEWSHLEWFHLSHRLLVFIARVAAQLPVEIDHLAPTRSRRTEGVRAKKALTHRMGTAERRVFGGWLGADGVRPLHIEDARNSYRARHVHAPSAEATAIIEAYISELNARPEHSDSLARRRRDAEQKAARRLLAAAPEARAA